MDSASCSQLVGRMHFWLESMRVKGGYGGPVSHWWRDSLYYAGPGLDWRYEGIINGYLNLFQSTGDRAWLAFASTAGRDLINNQLENGNFKASAFERNPELGGTPHEACASAAILRLARLRRNAGLEWRMFAESARRNLEWHIEALWNEHDQTFSDTVGRRSYVPNKIASTVEAFLELARLNGENVEPYVRSGIETVLSLQVEEDERRGAIHQLWVPEGNDGKMEGDGKFFPLYIARCIPPLISAGEWLEEKRFIDAARRAGDFLRRIEHPEGSFPQVVYDTGDRNEYPRWIAGVGDILRAYDELTISGYEMETADVENWLLSGFDSCGAFQTARGFGQMDGHVEEQTFEDVLHVVGWNDKAFRWLTSRTDRIEQVEPVRTSQRCTFDGTVGRYVEDRNRIEFETESGQGPEFRWDKESRWTRRTRGDLTQ